MDQNGEFARDLVRELGELGYFVIMHPEVHGGTGMENPYVGYTIQCEELARGTTVG